MKDNLDNILNQLMKVAEEDGRITEDEKILIKNLMSNAEKYIETLNEALEDGIIDKGEQSKLLQYRLNIAKKAKELALTDLIISREEKNLMLELHKILRDLETAHKKK
jgi:hypothetical protein